MFVCVCCRWTAPTATAAHSAALPQPADQCRESGGHTHPAARQPVPQPLADGGQLQQTVSAADARPDCQQPAQGLYVTHTLSQTQLQQTVSAADARPGCQQPAQGLYVTHTLSQSQLQQAVSDNNLLKVSTSLTH